MQVDPIKPTLKAPGTQLLELQYDELLSCFAFNLNLRRYIKDPITHMQVEDPAISPYGHIAG